MLSDMHPLWEMVHSSHTLDLRSPFHFSSLQWRGSLAISRRSETTAVCFLSFFVSFVNWAVESVDGALEKSFVLYLECRHFSCAKVVRGLCKMPSCLVKLSGAQG